MSPDAYLDIETTGLSWQSTELTVIGIYVPGSRKKRVVQLVGADASAGNLLEALGGVASIYTYNGRRFDLPFIKGSIGVDLAGLYEHYDLMYDCWECNLYGGFKSVERQLGIPRELKGISGWDAVLLWQRYRRGDEQALATLLAYNREDVVNLKVLRERLGAYMT